MTEGNSKTYADDNSGVWGMLVWGLGLLPCITSLFWPRSFDLAEYLGTVQGGFSQKSLLIAKIGTICTILLVLIALYRAFASHIKKNLDPQLAVGVAALAIGPFLSSFLGTMPKFSVGHMIPPLLFLVILISPPIPFDKFTTSIKHLILFYVYGSFLAALVAPNWAMEMSYEQGYLPFMKFRLHGITIHAIQLALLAWLYILFETLRPSKGFIGKINLFFVLLALLLTQSKTTWMMAFLSYFFMRISDWKFQQKSISFNKIVLFGFLGIVFIVGTYDIFMDKFAEIMSERYEDIITVTGRLFIWIIVLEKVMENPFFGYGPHLWDTEMSTEYMNILGWAPTQAHNQYMQTLGEAGIVGLAGLLIYAYILVAKGWQIKGYYKGIMLLVPLMWLFRGLTEAWYRHSVTDGNLFVHFIIFSSIVLISRESIQERRGS